MVVIIDCGDDTWHVGCYPFTDEDPFVIDECPHVFFSGNQAKGGTKLLQGVCIHTYLCYHNSIDMYTCIFIHVRHMQ